MGLPGGKKEQNEKKKAEEGAGDGPSWRLWIPILGTWARWTSSLLSLHGARPALWSPSHPAESGLNLRVRPFPNLSSWPWPQLFTVTSKPLIHTWWKNWKCQRYVLNYSWLIGFCNPKQEWNGNHRWKQLCACVCVCVCVCACLLGRNLRHIIGGNINCRYRRFMLSLGRVMGRCIGC